MSHRKFEAPRHGHLGFLPRKRSKRVRGKLRSFPKDNRTKKPHLTAFMGYKAGMTHIVRDVNKPGSKLHKKETVEGVTIVETPPMVIVGVTAYAESATGLKALGVVWAQHLSNSFRRNLYRRWHQSKRKAFTRACAYYEDNHKVRKREETLERFKKEGVAVRVIAHTQPEKIKQLGQKKAHVMEIQINGGSVEDKVDYGISLLEKTIPVSEVFRKDEPIDTCAVTKGKGFKGVVSRWGVTRLPRKTHKGLRKVACIGAWHPARVMYSVARAGQKGFHKRTQMNLKIYRMGQSLYTDEGKKGAMTENDLTEKPITPIGGFPNYGHVKDDWIMLKGGVMGPPKRVITLRKTMIPDHAWDKKMKEEINLKFIDTSSKQGHGTFQTSDEKKKFMGPLKKDILRKQREDEKKLEALKEKRKREEQEA